MARQDCDKPEFTAKIARLPVRIWEVPIRYRGRSYGEGKKIGWRDGFRALWAIAKYTDRATINRTAFGVTAVALTIAWLWGEIASYMKLRLHLPLPETK